MVLKFTFKMRNVSACLASVTGLLCQAASHSWECGEDERYSAVNRVKTTDVDLPRRESGMMRKRIKEFPSVLF